MGDRQFGPSRGRGRGQSKMRMDDPSLNSSKRKREEEGGDPVLSLLSLVLRIGDRLRVRQKSEALHVVFACSNLLQQLDLLFRTTNDLSKKR